MRLRVLAGLLTLGFSVEASASDHFDSPSVVEDPAADIADLYSFMTPDAARLEIVVTYAGLFQPGVQYVLQIGSMAQAGGSETELVVICSFDQAGDADCWAGSDEHAKGNARKAVGIESESGKLRVYSGPARDPFSFNADGFSATLAKVIAAKGALGFDGAGCPLLDASTAQALASGLGTDAFGGAAANKFEGARVSALVLSLEKGLVTAGGPIVAVWASTRR